MLPPGGGRSALRPLGQIYFHLGYSLQFFIDNWYLVVLALVSGALLAWPKLRGGAGSGVSAAEAVQLMNRSKAVLIDVCEPDEYAAGHVAGSRNVPLASLEGAKALPSNKALPLVVVCASGMRANKAAAKLRSLGYENAQALSGGLAAWKAANLPVEKSAT